MDVLSLIYDSLTDGHLCYFQVLALTNKNVINIHVQIFVGSYAFIYF